MATEARLQQRQRQREGIISGVSHMAFVVTSQEKLEACVSFYSRLGFKTINLTSELEKGGEGDGGRARAKDVSLHLFSSEATNLHATDVTLKISTGRAVTSPQTEEKDLRLQPVVLAFLCRDLQALEEQFAGLPGFQKHTFPANVGARGQNAPLAEIYVRDPAGHALMFTNRSSSFSTAPLFDTPRAVIAERVFTSSPQPAQALTAEEGQQRRKKIGVLTSGGDSQGMNAAVRAIVRVAIAKGCDPYAIYEGYEGLVNGGDMIAPMKWDSVRGWLSLGGTVIGTARCSSFRTRDGRLKAAYNLVVNGIDALVVIGGDGSLSGADLFRSEWPDLLNELVQHGKLQKEQVDPHAHLTIVGLVGSIDNDMSLTDITIGAVSSLHRICEAVDSIAATAMSHSRAFVVEVMGRHCGWLALSAAISTGADWAFLPESPPPLHWEEEMCGRLAANRKLGKRMTIVIVCEGAIDRNVRPIKSEQIKDILVKMGLDTRVTTLGHVQRGGTPCFFDRYLATVQGVEAIDAILRATPTSPSPVIGMCENKITCIDLMKAVETTHAVAKAIEAKDFDLAMELRDPEFASTYEANKAVNMMDHDGDVPTHMRLRIAIMHVGAPAGGMNAAVRTIARLCLNRGHTPLAIRNGVPGLIAGDIAPLKWLEVESWMTMGGCELGTNRAQPEMDIGMCAYQLQRHNVNGIVVIGGFEAFTAVGQLERARCLYPSLCIPMIVIPATVSNNVPGTEYSVGSDTALNAIVDSCDRIKQSATASRRRVFVVETQGGRCGYLATLAGLAAGATSVYIPEEGLSLRRLRNDVAHLVRRYSAEPAGTSEGRIILRCENTSPTYTTEIVTNIIKEEGRGLFDARTAVLGHTQQGGTPSPLDRIRATRLAVRSVNWIEQQLWGSKVEKKQPELHTRRSTIVPNFGCIEDHVEKHLYDSLRVDQRAILNGPTSAVVIGIRGAHLVFTPVSELQAETDVKNRRSLSQWWMDLTKLIRLLVKYEEAY